MTEPGYYHNLHSINHFQITEASWFRDLDLAENDLSTAHRVAGRIEAGYVWINGSSAHFIGAPFGGYKHSGLGRDESIDEMIDFTQVKNVNVGI